METGLKGKRVLVTAASKGLGRAVAEAFLAEGARVAISSSSEDRIRQTARELDDRGEVIAMAADIGEADECAELLDWTLHNLGGLDVLINNTVGPPPGTLESLDEAMWRHAFDTILMSAVRLSRGALPALRADGGGAIVNLASLTAKQPIDGLMLSNALRPALVGMAKTLAREAAPDVRVNNIATEHILTDRIRNLAATMWARDGETGDQVVERLAGEVPLRRYGTPAELANAVVFLAGDAASFITGVTLAVDGGLDRGLY
ncbi:MAG TPA: SDR family oxidoreductase [Candidatus Solibacter sp.]|jgi:3-oxoacyl-[acyl-carrier protein] reductase|nr:SDR family oxidoreductase [Candidatus Solibacter sp.]